MTVALSVPGRYRLVPGADELDLQRLTVSLAYIVFSSLHGRYSEDLRASVSAPMEHGSTSLQSAVRTEL